MAALSLAVGIDMVSGIVVAARRRPRRARLRLGVAVLEFSTTVVEEFEFCPKFPACTGKSKQKAEAAKTNANSKLLKRTIFMHINYPPVSAIPQALGLRKWMISSGEIRLGKCNGSVVIFYHSGPNRKPTDC
jgi:hypothetical protein